MNKLCFIITTFNRDNLLYKSVESLLPYLKDNKLWSIIIVDQGEMTEEKENWLNDNNFDSINYSRKNNNQQLFYYQVPYNAGLSFCRNYGVKKAKESGCDYCVISSDSFLLNKSIIRLNSVIKNINETGYDKCGFELNNCTVGWEAFLRLLPNEAFELDFIDKSALNNGQKYFDVDICRNFYVATTDSLFNVPFDNNLKLAEHEDQAWRYKQAGYLSMWTNWIIADKMTDRPVEYDRLRNTNFNEGIKYLKQKWGIKSWVKYMHLERAKEFYKGE